MSQVQTKRSLWWLAALMAVLLLALVVNSVNGGKTAR